MLCRACGRSAYWEEDRCFECGSADVIKGELSPVDKYRILYGRVSVVLGSIGVDASDIIQAFNNMSDAMQRRTMAVNREVIKRVARVKKGDKASLERRMQQTLVTTQDKEFVEESIHWAQWEKQGDGYVLTLLGFINGILDELTGGKVLIGHTHRWHRRRFCQLEYRGQVVGEGRIMAIKDLLATLKDETNLLAKLDIYLETMEQSRKPDGFFHPSMASQCPRYIQYYMMGFQKKPFSAQTMRVMDNGTKVHERLQEYFTDMGVMLEQEKKLKYTIKTPAPSITVVGSADGVLKLKEKIIIEIKSCNSFMYARFLKGGASPDHICQWNLYSYGLKIPKGIILYENKNTQELLAISVAFDRKLFDDTINKFKKVKKALNSGKIIPRPYKGMSDKKCLSCDFKDECWKR